MIKAKTKNKKHTAPAAGTLVIGGADKQTIQEATRAIVEILSIPGIGDAPRAEAMIALREMAKAPGNVRISDCVFNSLETP